MFLVFGIILHGLLHFFGFARLWHILNPGNFTEHTLFFIPVSVQKSLGIFWLCAMLLFLLTAAALRQGRRYWMILAVAAMLVSQALIVIYWKDAKAGTVANLVLCIPLVIAFGNWRFDQAVEAEIKRMRHVGNTAMSINSKIEVSIKQVPECVQQWLNASGGSGGHAIRTVKLKQEGLMRMEPYGKWMATSAVQYFDLKDPAFIWKAKVHMNNMIWYSGRDKLENGSGNMLIKLYALLPIVNSSGPEIDQGNLLRFLGELCWFPSAGRSSYISWEDAGDKNARAILRYGNATVSGIFSFNANGNISGFRAKRYMTINGRTTLEDWCVTCTAWQKMNGFIIPVKGEVTWKLKTGDFTYYKWKINEISYT